MHEFCTKKRDGLHARCADSARAVANPSGMTQTLVAQPTLRPSPSITMVTPVVEPPAPPASRVVLALGAMLLFALCAGLGTGEPAVAVRVLPIIVAPLFGAMLLTAPALFAMHQFLGLHARPETMVIALSRALVVGGHVAAGLSPTALFFAATTGLWPYVVAFGGALVGIAAATTAARALHQAECAGGQPSSRFSLLVSAWLVLGTLVSLRLAADLVITIARASALP